MIDLEPKKEWHPLFYIPPWQAVNEYCVDNLFRGMRIKVQNNNEFAKPLYFSYEPDKQFMALNTSTIRIFLYPPNKERDHWLLKIVEGTWHSLSQDSPSVSNPGKPGES